MRNQRNTRRIIGTALAVAFMTGGVAVNAAPANAVGGSCSATLQEKEQTGLNGFRSRASCSSLQGDSRARPRLIRDGGPDYTGPYFTTLNKYYYTDYYTCYAGCSASYEIGHV